MTDSSLRRVIERSTVARRLGATDDRPGATGVLRTASRDSRLGAWVRHAAKRGRRAADRSAVRDVGSRLADWTDGAGITALAANGADAVRASWLYRWLTAEPDPDVVVIDLRETVTVAPFIAAVDEFVRAILSALPGSSLVGAAESAVSSLPDEPVRNASIMALGVVLAGFVLTVFRGLPDVVVLTLAILAVMALAGTQIRLSWDELGETRVADLVRAALEPPDPPAHHHPGDADRRESDSTESVESSGAPDASGDTPDRRPDSE